MSKKQIVRLIAIIVMIAMFCVTFTSCNIFIKENAERVSNQTLVTIEKDGITLTITQYELLEYYSTYAYYLIYYYGYDVDTAFDWAVENKIKSKYLTIEGMLWLSDSENRAERTSSLLMGSDGTFDTPYEVLTPAEYYAAILSVNESVESSVETYMEEYYQEQLDDIVDDLQTTDVVGIEFLESYEDADGNIVTGTVTGSDSNDGEIAGYLQDEYYVDQGIDTDSILFRVIYENEDGTYYYSDPAIVPTSMYTTAFDSTTEGTDYELTISFEEKVVDDDGETTFEEHVATYSYDVVSPRDTKTTEEETDVDEITLADDVVVNRYATVAEIESAGGIVEMLDLDAIYEELKSDLNADAAEVDAYRQLTEALASNYTTLQASYDSAFESAVITALSVEVKKGTDAEGEITVSDQEIYDEFMYLYTTGSTSYSATDTETNTSTFGSSLTSGLESVYYLPTEDLLELGEVSLSDYFYVMQILFSFSDEDAAFATEYISSKDEDEAYNQAIYEMLLENTTTTASNPDYDPDYDCPCCEMGGDESECIYEGDGICPSQAYYPDEEYVTDVMASLEAELLKAETSAEKYAIFEKYMYMYNDDPGTMNSSSGYLIAPSYDDAIDDPNGFYESFLELAWLVAGDTPTVGDAMATDDDGDEYLAYTFTPYGIHLICVSMTPFSGENSYDFASMSVEEVIAALNKNLINVNGENLYDILYETIYTEKETARYTNYNNATVPTDIDENEDYVTIETDKIADLKAEYTGT
ncbi:MAG: hypothetical protein R3Y23_04040 [Bacillota bacterium]